MCVFPPAFYSGICLTMILVLAALLSTVATVRESVCLMAMVSVWLDGHGWAGNSVSKFSDNTKMWRYREEPLSGSSLLPTLGLSTVKCGVCSVALVVLLCAPEHMGEKTANTECTSCHSGVEVACCFSRHGCA